MSNKVTPQVVIENVYGAANIAAALAAPFLRFRRLRWGATRAEMLRTLPGDEFVPKPKWSYTHAITIRAPVATVWPWVVQIGQGRGGLYSYELLENLGGSNMENADEILPEFQQLNVGDKISIHPKVPAIPVVRVEPYCYVLLHADSRTVSDDEDSVAPKGEFLNYSWLWYLEDRENGTTRFIVRSRSDYSAGLRLWFGPLFMEPVGFVMERRMMLGIKQRAEKALKLARQSMA